MRNILCFGRLKIILCIWLSHCYIWPVLLYGPEAWKWKTNSGNIQRHSKCVSIDEWCNFMDSVIIIEEVLRLDAHCKLSSSVKWHNWIMCLFRHDRCELQEKLFGWEKSLAEGKLVEKKIHDCETYKSALGSMRVLHNWLASPTSLLFVFFSSFFKPFISPHNKHSVYTNKGFTQK